ncbi:hypothetical protein JHK87_024810 [Glycine soja]|nr:hypothetical protein JHK87_024810 [Glycine soja]
MNSSDLIGAFKYFNEMGLKDPFLVVTYTADDSNRLQNRFSSETEETYVWLLEQFNDIMKGKALCSVITDGNVAMRNAIRIVYLSAFHRFAIFERVRKHGQSQASSFGSGVCNLVIRRHVNVLGNVFGMNWITNRHLLSMSKDENTWKLLQVASDECGLSHLHCVSKHTGKQNND